MWKDESILLDIDAAARRITGFVQGFTADLVANRLLVAPV